MSTIIKKYHKDELTVIWQPHLCEHSTKCFRGLPEVFDPRVRPWVRTEGATIQDIIQQVEQCPSGALQYIQSVQEFSQSSTIDTIMEEQTEQVEQPQFKVEVIKGGPLRVHGPFVVHHRDGRTEIKERASLCRCGQSKNKPFCDGTHKSIGWDLDE